LADRHAQAQALDGVARFLAAVAQSVGYVPDGDAGDTFLAGFCPQNSLEEWWHFCHGTYNLVRAGSFGAIAEQAKLAAGDANINSVGRPSYVQGLYSQFFGNRMGLLAGQVIFLEAIQHSLT